MRIAYEYDGAYWHNNVKEYDDFRDELLINKGWVVFRIKEKQELMDFMNINVAEYNNLLRGALWMDLNVLNALNVNPIPGVDLVGMFWSIASGVSPGEIGTIIGLISIFMLAKKSDMFITLIQIASIILIGLILFGVINI